MVAELHATPADAETDAPRQDWRERPIIVCDPTRFTRRLTVDVLRFAGAERVQTCTTRDSALWFARNAKDPILVVDWRDERLDAPGLVRELRRGAPEVNTAPALVLSTKHRLIDVEHARDSGVDTVALRPIAPRDVTERLTEITRRPRPFVTTPSYCGPDRRVRSDGATAYKRDRDVADGRTDPLNAARAQAQSMIFSMLRRNDPLAARIGRSLERYLAGLTALSDRDREIITLHRASLGRVLDLQAAANDVRLEVITGLEALVARRAGV